MLRLNTGDCQCERAHRSLGAGTVFRQARHGDGICCQQASWTVCCRYLHARHTLACLSLLLAVVLVLAASAIHRQSRPGWPGNRDCNAIDQWCIGRGGVVVSRDLQKKFETKKKITPDIVVNRLVELNRGFVKQKKDVNLPIFHSLTVSLYSSFVTNSAVRDTKLV
jgi:hypothetical protein